MLSALIWIPSPMILVVVKDMYHWECRAVLFIVSWGQFVKQTQHDAVSFLLLLLHYLKQQHGPDRKAPGFSPIPVLSLASNLSLPIVRFFELIKVSKCWNSKWKSYYSNDDEICFILINPMGDVINISRVKAVQSFSLVAARWMWGKETKSLTPRLMEPGGSMHSQGLSNNPYPEPNQPNSPHWYLSLPGPF